MRVQDDEHLLQNEIRDNGRLLKVQVDRVAEGIRTTTVGALAWFFLRRCVC